MGLVIAISSLLLVVAVSLLATRVATVILVATGMSRAVARFQARSALTGAGFTTSESEAMVNHPVRRRVVMALRALDDRPQGPAGDRQHAEAVALQAREESQQAADDREPPASPSKGTRGWRSPGDGPVS